MTKKEVRIIAQQFAEVIKKRWKKPLRDYDLVKSKNGIRAVHYMRRKSDEKLLGEIVNLIEN